MALRTSAVLLCRAASAAAPLGVLAARAAGVRLPSAMDTLPHDRVDVVEGARLSVESVKSYLATPQLAQLAATGSLQSFIVASIGHPSTGGPAPAFSATTPVASRSAAGALAQAAALHTQAASSESWMETLDTDLYGEDFADGCWIP